MGRCTICLDVYYPQSETDPDELCTCGQMAVGTPWSWDRWRALRNVARYRVANFLVRIASGLYDGGYR